MLKKMLKKIYSNNNTIILLIVKYIKNKEKTIFKKICGKFMTLKY